MRLFLLTFLFLGTIYASDTINFFKASKDNKLICHVGQYSFKVLSQENATLQKMNGHTFFKLKNENLYFLNNSCQELKNNKNGIIF